MCHATITLSVLNWGNTQVHIEVVQLVELSFYWSVAIHRKIYLRRRLIDNAQVIYDTD